MTKMEGVALLRLSWKYSVREAKAVSRDGRIATSKKKALTEERETLVQNSCKDLVTKKKLHTFYLQIGFHFCFIVLFVYNKLTHGVKLLRKCLRYRECT